MFVNWQLHGVGIAKTADYLCGELEHEHTAACYETVSYTHLDVYKRQVKILLQHRSYIR